MSVWSGKLTSLGGLSLVLACLLLPQLSFERWQASTGAANIDFFTLWSVPHARALAPDTDIYSPAGQLDLGAILAREAAAPGTPVPQRMVTTVVRELYGGRVDATATPFAYAVVRLFSSGRYDRDVRRFVVVSWLAFAVAIVLLCALLRFSPVATVLAFLVFTSSFAPIQAELRVANVNQVQLLGVALLLWFTARSQFWLAGLVLGAAIIFKPNLGPVLLFLGVVALADGRLRRWQGLFGGAAVAVVAGVLLSAAWFGGFGIWGEFAASLRRTTAVTYPLESGNFGLPALVFALCGWKVSWLVALALVGLFVGLTLRSRPAGGAEGLTGSAAAEQDLHLAYVVAGVACAVTLLASNLAWLHYYILLIPLALYLLRPIPDTDPDRVRRLACGGAAVAALLLFSSSVQYMAGGARPAAALVNIATVLLLAGALDDFWRQRTGAAASAPGPKRRPRNRPAGGGRRQVVRAFSRRRLPLARPRRGGLPVVLPPVTL